MRDQIKNKAYFEKFILEDSERIHKFSRKLANDEVRPERIFAVKAMIHDLKLGILIAKYSKGERLETLKKEYLQLVKEWQDIWQKDYYNKALKMISLGVLFDVDRAILSDIKSMIKKSGINDWLFDFLLQDADHDRVEKERQLLFPKSFATLKEAVYAGDTVGHIKIFGERMV